jgi:hypothetical protein
MESEKAKRQKEKLQEALEIQKLSRDAGWPVQHWRAWGSWFSWGSPVGLGLFFALTLISLGVFIWLIQL